MIILNSEAVNFSPTSIIDDVGKVFFFQGRVFRAIYSKEHAEIYSRILKEAWFSGIFDSGLVKTWISPDVSLEDAYLTLEHEAIPFETHPAESTSLMHWMAAKALVKVSLSLSKHGFLLKDAHPWNVMFNRGVATVIDFGSIINSATVPESWLREFRRYFCVPIRLAAGRWEGYALEYRRQHGNGFGLKLFDSKILNRTIFNGINRLTSALASPVDFFERIDSWLEQYKPLTNKKEYWADYHQCGGALNHLKPELPKQKFVHDILNAERPAKVLDFAANKGYYSEMAARLGAEVLACDYEEFCVDKCLYLAQKKHLAITPVLLDFNMPTPGYGMGLYGRDSFARFQSDIVLTLGIIHHLCFTQKIPVEIFCDICMKYAKNGVILEYVDPTDKHVANWGIPTPVNYSIEGLVKFFSKKFPRIVLGETISSDGICRVMIYFGKE